MDDDIIVLTREALKQRKNEKIEESFHRSVSSIYRSIKDQFLSDYKADSTYIPLNETTTDEMGERICEELRRYFPDFPIRFLHDSQRRGLMVWFETTVPQLPTPSSTGGT